MLSLREQRRGWSIESNEGTKKDEQENNGEESFISGVVGKWISPGAIGSHQRI